MVDCKCNLGGIPVYKLLNIHIVVSWVILRPRRIPCVIGGIGPFAIILHETMFLGILVDVGYQVDEVGFGSDSYTAKGIFEKAAGAMVGLVAGR